MEKSSCELLSGSFPNVSELENLRWSILVNLVVNNFLSYTAIMLNVVTIHVIRKTSSLPDTLKTLLLNLAVTDVGVGIIVQPVYSSLLVRWLQHNIEDCNFRDAFVTILSTFCLASFLGVVAVSVDRFLAIHLHLRYQEFVTHNRVVSVVISIWVTSTFLPFSIFAVSLYIYSYIMVILDVLGAILITITYVRIYLIVRQHKNQIQVLQVQQVAHGNQAANLFSLIKSTVGIFYVYFVFLLCYLPYLISLAATKMNGPSIILKGCSVFSLTLVFLNSSLNPVIYCWKMKHIRHAVMNILRNMSRQRSHASQEILPIAGHNMP